MAVHAEDQVLCDQVDGWLNFALEEGGLRVIQMDYHMLDERQREVVFLYLLGQTIEARHLSRALQFIVKQEGSGT